MPGKGGTSDEMRRMMEETQKKCVTPRAAAGEVGINSFLFNSKLPVHKNERLVKTKDEQAAALLKGEFVFVSVGQWCTLEFTFLESCAIPRAQKNQLKMEAKRNADQ